MSWFGNHRTISTILVALFTLSLAMPVTRHLQVEAQYRSGQIPNELIIKFNPEFSLSSEILPAHLATQIPVLGLLISNANLKEIIQLDCPQAPSASADTQSATTFHLIFSDSIDFSRLLPELNQHNLIEFAEPNYCYRGAGNPNQSWKLLAEASLEKLDLPAARQLTRNSNVVIIGLIDADFKRLAAPPAATASNHLKEWINSADIVHLNNPALPETSREYSSQHGYLLSGIIHQIVTETKPHTPSPIKILPISAGTSISEACPEFTATRCAAAIDYAVDHQAKIILLGWSGPGPSRLLQNSINRAFAHGALIVAAAGNQNQTKPVFPAAWPHVLAVASADLNDRKCKNSNFGKWIDVSAPGELTKTQTWGSSGTSAAAAIVAGLAALIQSDGDEISPDSLTRRIIYSCDNIDSLNLKYPGLLGAGRVNALRAIKGDFQPNITLREHEIEKVPANSPSENHFRYRISLSLENIAADASEVKVQILGLPPEIPVNPPFHEISDFRFRQTRRCNFEVQFPTAQAKLQAQLIIAAENAFHKSIPLNLSVARATSSDIADSVSDNGSNLSRRFKFRQQIAWSVGNGTKTQREIVLLGSDSAEVVKCAIWKKNSEPDSFVLNINVLTGKNSFFNDLNADGLPDLCLGNETAWQVFENVGGNEFSQNPVATLTTALPFTGFLMDLNFDGFPDFLTNNPELTIYDNRGDWNFSPRKSGIPLAFSQLKIIDLNSDGHPDLIGRPKEADNLRIYWGSNFCFSVDHFTELEIRANDFEILPLDSEFSNDLIVVESKPGESLLKIYRNLSGQFTKSQNLTLSPIRQILTGDIDHDQDFDLLILFKNRSSQIFLNDGVANFTGAPFRFTKKSLTFGTLIDFNDDGALDLLGSAESGDSVEIFLNHFAGETNIVPPEVPQKLTQKIDSTEICLSWELMPEKSKGETCELRLWSGTNATAPAHLLNIGSVYLGQSNQFKFMPETGKKYFWTVQAVDAASRHSGWAPVQQVRRFNRPPEIFSFWPRQDTTLAQGDSLCFRAKVIDADGDSLRFNWQTGAGKSSDSTLNFIAGTVSDSVLLKISDGDTTISVNWQISIKKSLLDLARFFPAAETTLVTTDSLIFRVAFPESEKEKFRFSWRTAALAEFEPGENTFKFLPKKNTKQETLIVQICRDDSCWFHQWEIGILRANTPPKFILLRHAGDSTVLAGDSLKFSCKAFDADGDSLKIFWQTNSAQTGTDSVFHYVAPTRQQFSDSVWVTVADADTSIRQAWEIKIRRSNLPPVIMAHFPDSLSFSVKEGDSLNFSIHARDSNADSLSFTWLNVDSARADSMQMVKWNYFSAGFDSVGVRVTDPDTVIEFWWRIQVRNTNRLPEIARCFPHSDTTLFDADSLEINLEVFDPDSQPVEIFWQKNKARVGEFDNQPFFRLLAPDDFPQKDTIVVHISDSDTTLQKQWVIIFRQKNHCPELIHFWPTKDTLLIEGDSLKFQVQGVDEDADSLKYFWHVNRQPVASFGSLFHYQANFFPPGIDTVEVKISDGDTLVNHRWLVKILNINTAPTVPKPLSPLRGEILLESERLHWCSASDPDPEDKQLTYFVRIASDTTFKSVYSVDLVKADTVLFLRGCSGFYQFESGSTYYWCVRAVDHSGDTSRIFPVCGCFRFQHVSARILKAYANNNGEGGITIFWETIQEKGNLGFNILKKTSSTGEFQRINEMLIRGTSPYSYLDSEVAAGETYYYCIECVSVTGITFRHDVIEVSAPVPAAFALDQNYPNPLTLETLIRFQIPRKCHVSLSVYNILGEEVRKLVQETREKGFYDVIWNGRDETGSEVGSGVYFYSITAENYHETRKIMVVR